MADKKGKGNKKSDAAQKPNDFRFTIKRTILYRALGFISTILKTEGVPTSGTVIALTADPVTKKVLIEGSSIGEDYPGAYASYHIDAVNIDSPGFFSTGIGMPQVRFPDEEVSFFNKDGAIGYKSGRMTGTFMALGSREEIRNHAVDTDALPEYNTIPVQSISALFGCVLFSAKRIEDQPDVLIEVGVAPLQEGDIPKAKIKRKNTEDEDRKPPNAMLTAFVFDRERYAYARVPILTKGERGMFDEREFGSTFLRTVIAEAAKDGLATAKVAVNESAISVVAGPMRCTGISLVSQLRGADQREIGSRLRKTAKPLFTIRGINGHDLGNFFATVLSAAGAAGAASSAGKSLLDGALHIEVAHGAITASVRSEIASAHNTLAPDKDLPFEVQGSGDVFVDGRYLSEFLFMQGRTVTLLAYEAAIFIDSRDEGGLHSEYIMATMAKIGVEGSAAPQKGKKTSSKKPTAGGDA